MKTVFGIIICSVTAGAFQLFTKTFHRTFHTEASMQFDPRDKYAEKNLIPKKTAEYFGPINGGDMKTNVFDALVKMGNFKTLTTAIKAAGLDGKMANQLTTLFAPTDEAFSKLPAGNIEALLNDIPTLKDLILFHVHPGKLNCTRNARSFNTALKSPNGAPKQLAVKVASWTEEVFIVTGQPNIPKVTTRSVICTNGLINVINEIMIPYEGETPPQVTFIGARDLKDEATLQLGYYGKEAGTDRHGKIYDGPEQEYKPIPVERAVWAVAGNWFADAAQNAPGMSSSELTEW